MRKGRVTHRFECQDTLLLDLFPGMPIVHLSLLPRDDRHYRAPVDTPDVLFLVHTPRERGESLANGTRSASVLLVPQDGFREEGQTIDGLDRPHRAHIVHDVVHGLVAGSMITAAATTTTTVIADTLDCVAHRVDEERMIKQNVDLDLAHHRSASHTTLGRLSPEVGFRPH